MFNIISTHIEGFRSFKEKCLFKFPTECGLYHLTGVNLDNPRLGPNGVGKSSLLDAIFWCFFGITTRGLKAGDIVTWGDKGCTVAVEIASPAGHATIQRTQNPNSLTWDDEPIDQADLQKRLRFTPEACKHAVMFPQFHKPFFDLTPTEKLNLFSDILELQFWLDKSNEANVMAMTLADQRETLEKLIARYEGRLEAIFDDIEAFKIKEREFEDIQNKEILRLKREHRDKAQILTRLLLDEGKVAKAQANAERRLPTSTKLCSKCKQPTMTAEDNEQLQVLRQNAADFASEHRRIMREVASLQSELVSLNSSVDKEKQRKNPYSSMIARKTDESATVRQDLAKQQKRLDETITDHAAASFWVGGFKRLRLMIVEQALTQLELEVNNSLSRLGLINERIEFDIERENKAGGVTKGFVVLIHTPKHDKPIRWECWSGGETQRLRMAGDLGLANLIMQRAGLLGQIEFFDEPSHHLSAEGLLDLAETLHERATDEGKCVIIADHHLIEHSFTGKIVITKNASGSTVTCPQ